MILWQTKSTSAGTYTTMKTPSSYEIEGNDLDSDSYRSISTGNLNRTIIGKKWLSVKMEFNYLTEAELEALMTVLNYYPMYTKLKSPVFGTNGFWEGEMYCSKFNVSMQQNADNNAQTWNSLSFTLVQSKKVSGQ